MSSTESLEFQQMGIGRIAIIAVGAAIILSIMTPSLLTVLYPLDIDQSGETTDIQYHWIDGSVRSLTASIPENAIRSYNDSLIPRFGNPYAAYRYLTVDDPVIQSVVTALEEMTDGIPDVDRMDFVLSFVQENIRYVSDSGSILDHWQFPTETLYLGTGDCEDSSLLFATLAKAMGHDVVLILQDGHMCAGVALEGASGRMVEHLGNEYVVCDTTADSRIGYGNDRPVKLIMGWESPFVMYAVISVILAVLGFFVYAFRV